MRIITPRESTILFGVAFMAHSQHAPHLPHTDNPAAPAKPGGHYSHIAIANGFVFVSGQLPINAKGEKHR